MQEMYPHHTSLADEPQDPIELMTENLLRIQQHMAQKSQSKQSEPAATQRVIEQYQPHQNDILYKEYQDFTSNLPENFPSMSYEQKISYILGEPQTGGLIYLFELVYYFREALPPESLVRIAATVTDSIDFDNEVQLRVALELLAIIGVADEEMLQSVSRMMLEEQIPFDLGFLYLCNMGYPGIFTLVDIANKDFNDVPLNIMDHLSRCEGILQEIVIPAVCNDLFSSAVDHRRKITSLAILNRMNRLVKDQKTVASLVKMLIEGAMDRGLLASTIRASGDVGEQLLLKLLANNSNNKIKLPIISVLPWRVPDSIDLEVGVVEYSIGAGFPPGVMYQYNGSLEPSAYVPVQEEGAEQQANQLMLNSRDFMAALHRMLSVKFQNGEHEQPFRKSPLNSKYLFLLVDLINSKNEEEGGDPNILFDSSISPEVIKCLGACLSNPIVEIRQAALNALGVIGLPDAQESLDKVVKCLSDVDSKNRSMACWTISKLCELEEPQPKLIRKMVELLKDSYWKVRTSACIALGAIVRTPNEIVIEGLVRALKDGSINKNTICQTMIHMGTAGEEILVEILKNTHHSDFKLKSAIIGCFKFADVSQPSIDFLIEQLFKHSSDDNIQVRALCLETLNHLRIRAKGENITYLKAKNILPLFYFYLEDASPKLREIAVEAILSFGSHAELIFIQGLTKSNSPLVRMESAKALCRMGVQNFRAIIFGLRDSDERVRKATAHAILNNFTKQQILEEFSRKDNQIPQLLCHLRDIAGSYTFPHALKSMFEELVGDLMGSKKRRTTTMDKQNEDSNIAEDYE